MKNDALPLEVLHVWHGARDIAALLAGFDADS
jgi:hypothetical protein